MLKISFDKFNDSNRIRSVNTSKKKYEDIKCHLKQLHVIERSYEIEMLYG